MFHNLITPKWLLQTPVSKVPFFFPRGEKKNSRPQHCDNYNNHTSHGFYSIVLHRLQCRKRIVSEYLPWARHCAKCVDHQGDEVRFLSSGAYKLAGEGRHKPQSEINSHKWMAWSVSATQGDWSAFLEEMDLNLDLKWSLEWEKSEWWEHLWMPLLRVPPGWGGGCGR